MEINQKEISTFTGANLFTANNAIILDYDLNVFGDDLSITDEHLQKIPVLISETISELISLKDILKKNVINDVNNLLTFLIEKFLNLRAPQQLAIKCISKGDGNYQLIVEFNIESHAFFCIKAAFLTASFIKSDLKIPSDDILQQRNYVFNSITSSLPGGVITDLLTVAKQRSIPFYPVGSRPLVTSYGQGSKAVIYDYASSEYDSFFGFALQKDKIMSNKFLNRLGYPTTEQHPIPTFEICQDVINNTGYPIVIKPLSSGQGKGVTVNIRSLEQAEKAFRDAEKISPGRTMLENFIEGDVYRITVSQHRLNTVYEMVPAHVTGDGKHTIEKLIALENDRRVIERQKGNKFKNLEIDELTRQELHNANLALGDIPETDQRVYLRRVSNAASGGIYVKVDYADVHPDVLEMMVDISKAFRLDNTGIDYIASDISKSWRDNGAIIEVNAFPTIETLLAEEMFDNHFTDKNDCRIETILVISDKAKFARDIYEAEKIKSPDIGYTSASSTIFKGGEMAIKGNDLYLRCLSLLLNPTCNGMVVFMTENDILNDGLPIDYFDRCIIDKNINFTKTDKTVSDLTGAKNLTSWLEKYVGTVEQQ